MPKDLKKERNQAELMFFDYKDPDEIAETLERPISTVWRWIRDGNWRSLRDSAKDAMIDHVREKKKKDIEEIHSLALPLIKKSIKEISESGHVLDTKEMRDLTYIITEFDKLVKLESGEATHIVKNLQNITIHDVREAIEQDEFIEVESEVINESGTGNGNRKTKGRKRGSSRQN